MSHKITFSLYIYYNKLVEKFVYTVHRNELCANIVFCSASCDHHKHTTRHQTHNIYACIYAYAVYQRSERQTPHRISSSTRETFTSGETQRSREGICPFDRMADWLYYWLNIVYILFSKYINIWILQLFRIVYRFLRIMYCKFNYWLISGSFDFVLNCIQYAEMFQAAQTPQHRFSAFIFVEKFPQIFTLVILSNEF